MIVESDSGISCWLLVASRYFSMRNISMISTSTQKRKSPIWSFWLMKMFN